MAVEVNTERKGVEISWDTGAGATPEPPEIWGGDHEPFPTPPIEITPPEVDQGPVEPPPSTGTEPPGYNPPVGLPDPPSYPYPVVAEDAQVVQVFAQGEDGSWHNTAAQPNDGLALLSYPAGFKGTSNIEIRALDGTVIDSGVITVE